jgi:hypothetical protein
MSSDNKSPSTAQQKTPLPTLEPAQPKSEWTKRTIVRTSTGYCSISVADPETEDMQATKLESISKVD